MRRGRGGCRPIARRRGCPSVRAASRLARRAASTRSGKRVVRSAGCRSSVAGVRRVAPSVAGLWCGWRFICGGSAGCRCAGSTARTPKWSSEGRAGAAGRGVAAVQGVAVLADVAGGEFGVLEGAAGFAVGHGFAGGAFAAGGLGGGEMAGDQDRFGAAAGEAFPLGAGEGVQEVLDERVQGGGLVGPPAVPVRVAPRTERAAATVGRMPSRRCRSCGWCGVLRSALQPRRRVAGRDPVCGACAASCSSCRLPLPGARSVECSRPAGWCGSWGGATAQMWAAVTAG